MSWIFAAVVFLVSMFTLIWFRISTRKELERIMSTHGTAVARLKKDETLRLERLTRESDSLKEDKVYDLVKELSTPLDALDEAIQFADKELIEGLIGVRNSIDQAFGRQDIERIEPKAGEVFLPNFHEAISSEPSDIERGRIIECLRCGWKSGERSIRTALVSVSSGREDII